MGKNKHPIECSCQRIERTKQEAIINQQKHNDLVRRLKTDGFSDSVMLNWTLENDNGRSPQMHHAQRYVEQWQTMRTENLGLLLWGGVGTGKSFLAGCIANALMELEVPVRITNFARILSELNSCFSGRNEVVDKLCRYPLLIIDDFGMERGTEYVLEQIYNIVDSRYRSRKPLIVTTNLTLDEIRRPQDTAHARIYDRLLEMCVPISCIGVSFRKETAQEKLERILQEISGAETEVFGSGRTDAGTHATGQVMNFHINWNGTAEQLLDAFNAKLPEDIAALSVAEMPPRFHSRLSAKAKHYSYSIWIGKHSPVFERKYTFRCTETLDVQAMRQAAAAFIGTHDFKSFCANKRMKKSTVRTIYDIVFEETEDKLTLHFYGNGFLYQMVRILAGTLIEVGEGKKNADETEQILLAKSREQAGFTAPSRGLFLREVFYEDWKGGSEA